MSLRSVLGAGRRLLVAHDARLVVGGGNRIHTSGKASMGFGSHASDNDPETLDKEKEKNLKGTAKTTLDKQLYEQAISITFIHK